MAGKRKPGGRRWVNDGFCVRLRPEYENHVWSYNFVSRFTHAGRTLRDLPLLTSFRARRNSVFSARSHSFSHGD